MSEAFPPRAGRRRGRSITVGHLALTLILALTASCASAGPYGGEGGERGEGGAFGRGERGGRFLREQEVRYWVYVADEASDAVSRVRFDKDSIAVDTTIQVGFLPAELDAPTGLSVSRDRRYWYLTTARGTPWGRLWKYRTGSDVLVGSVELGLSPGAIGLTPDGTLAFVANVDPHGDGESSSVSVVATEPVLTETGRVTTCVEPRGVRVGPDGEHAYSVCSGSDELVDMTVQPARVSRTLALPSTADSSCRPTWAEPSPDGKDVYVACGGASEVLDVDVARWAVTHRILVGASPQELAVTPNGRYLLATDRDAGAVSIVDLDRGTEVARVPTTRSLPHGIAISPDSRYAFVTNEAVGATPSTVDVLDVEGKSRVASVEVGHEATGIAFWRMGPVRGRNPRFERLIRPRERGEGGEGGEGGGEAGEGGGGPR